MNVLTTLALLAVLPVILRAQTQETFITQIRDLVIGKGASYTEVALYRQTGKRSDEHEKWALVASNITDVNGRIPNLVTRQQFPIGVYKLKFETEKYYAPRNYSTVYPYLEIIFEKSNTDQILIVVSLSPYGYSYYKGVNGIK